MPGARYVDNPDTQNPRILSSSGVSVGIDQAFYILREIRGNETLASTTATVMEYNETRNWVYGALMKWMDQPCAWADARHLQTLVD